MIRKQTVQLLYGNQNDKSFRIRIDTQVQRQFQRRIVNQKAETVIQIDLVIPVIEIKRHTTLCAKIKLDEFLVDDFRHRIGKSRMVFNLRQVNIRTRQIFLDST